MDQTEILVTIMKFHMVVILLLMAKVVPGRSEEEEEGEGGYTCRNQGLVELASCTNSARIQISKDSRNYQIRLCSNEQCMPIAASDASLDWIQCREICNACESLLGPNRKDVKFSYH